MTVFSQVPTEAHVPEVSSGPRRRRRSARQLRIWLFAVPAVALYTMVTLWPSLSGASLATTSENTLTNDSAFVGLDNFQQILSDDTMSGALVRTVLFAVGLMIGQTAVGLGLALLLHAPLKSRSILRPLFFAPVVLSPLVCAYVWKYMLGGSGGLNQLLESAGLGAFTHPWLGDPSTAMWGILVVVIWQFSGLSMAIFQAGLEAIPPEVMEAAHLDGANAWQRFRRIVLPQLTPALTITTVLSLIAGLTLFDQVLAITGGGPGGSTETISTLLYSTAFNLGQTGLAAALAVLLALGAGALATVQMLIVRRKD